MNSEFPIVVMKFGGSSLAGRERIEAVSTLIERALERGIRPVVAASAMGDTTDDLAALARGLSQRPRKRDYDLLLSTGEVVSCALLSIALNERGIAAQAVTGPGAGIVTDDRHGRARIEHIDPSVLHLLLDEGITPVVAGFQGASAGGAITTLGRGASDTTAIALAVALGADNCEIYTDVDGIFSADPRLVPRARKLEYISYEETLEMASLGARVMHPRSVELAERHKLRVTVRSSFNDRPGTELVSRKAVDIETGTRVRAVVDDADVARITVEGVPDAPGLARSLFEPLAVAGVNVDIIVQNLSHGGATDISFTVGRDEVESALQIVRKVAEDVGASGVTWSDELAKISIVGLGMRSGPGVAARMFGTLAERGINIISITTSEILITCLIEESRLQEAARALHTAFELDE